MYKEELKNKDKQIKTLTENNKALNLRVDTLNNTIKEKDKKYVLEKGGATIKSHAYDFIRKRLAPRVILNDGKQTPMRGHPVFISHKL